MKTISVKELKSKIDNKEDFQLIDIREVHEVEIAHINGEHIPMDLILSNSEKISKDKQVIIHCRSGQRSAAVVNALEQQFRFENLYNLTGGILAWADEIDPAMSKY
jgi:rhodanese-related sulfurtransferase